jgi:hypothetical protein
VEVKTGYTSQARKSKGRDVVSVAVKMAALEAPNERVGRFISSFANHLEYLERGLSFHSYWKRVVRRKRLTLLRILRGGLTHRHLLVIVVVLGVIITAPALGRGWGFEDDVLHRTTLLSASLPTALRELYVFLDPSKNARLMDLGVIPWWTLETVRVAFFRPLAALTHWLDYQLWPDSAALMHAHSILWYVGVCALVTLLYRRFYGRTVVAGLAAFLFAVDARHLNSVISLSARNALLALFFGLLTLLIHDRWRREGWRVGALLAPLCLALTLLSAEAGVAAVAYLVAYALCVDRGTWRRRLVSVLPYVAVVLIWRLVYQHLGYGAWGADFYVDPGREPLRFAAAILERAPVLLFGQWVAPDPAIYATLSTWASRAFWLAAALFVVVLVWLLLPLFRRSRVARFWGLGMALALAPACTISLPSGRHLIFVGVGAVGLLAQFAEGVLKRYGRTAPRSAHQTMSRAVGILLLVLNAIAFPILLPCSQSYVDPFFRAATDLGLLPEAGGKDVVVVSVPSPGQLLYVPGLRDLRGQPQPAHLRVLAPGYFAVAVTRTDERTLVVRPERGYVVPVGAIARKGWDLLPLAHHAYGYQYSGGFLRSDACSVALGQRVELSGMSVEVTALTDDGQPLEARVQFAVPLEDTSLKWLWWNWEQNAYLPFEPPAVGETVEVAGPF